MYLDAAFLLEPLQPARTVGQLGIICRAESR
jgi:hypothetical protein